MVPLHVTKSIRGGGDENNSKTYRRLMPSLSSQMGFHSAKTLVEAAISLSLTEARKPEAQEMESTRDGEEWLHIGEAVAGFWIIGEESLETRAWGQRRVHAS